MRESRPVVRGALRVLLLALAVSQPGAFAAEDYTKIEAAIQVESTKLVKLWVGLADEMADRGLPAEASGALEAARRLAPEAPEIELLARRIAALPAGKAADELAAKRIAKTKAEAAKAYDRMAAVLEKEQQDARYPEFLLTGLDLDPTTVRLGRIGGMAQMSPLLVRAPGQTFAGLLSLSKSWKPGKPEALVLCLEGERLRFHECLGRYRTQRGNAAGSLLAPLILSPGVNIEFDRYMPAYTGPLITKWNEKRLEFDETGLPGLLAFLRKHFGAGPRMSIVSEGRGGLLATRLLSHHAADLEAAALIDTPFDAGVLAGAPEPAGAGPRVLLFGSSALAEGDASAQLAEALNLRGLSEVRRAAAPGATHADLAARAWTFLVEPAQR